MKNATYKLYREVLAEVQQRDEKTLHRTTQSIGDLMGTTSLHKNVMHILTSVKYLTDRCKADNIMNAYHNYGVLSFD